MKGAFISVLVIGEASRRGEARRVAARARRRESKVNSGRPRRAGTRIEMPDIRWPFEAVPYPVNLRERRIDGNEFLNRRNIYAEVSPIHVRAPHTDSMSDIRPVPSLLTV